MGELSNDEIRDWIIKKVLGVSTPSKSYRGNAGQCAGDFSSHNGSSSGGGTRFTHNNRTVFHASHGNGQHSGCTIFFVCADQSAGVGKIVAIGFHRDSTTYELDWVDPHWMNSPMKAGHTVRL
ncbi:MAG: hypothetical protein H6710_13375 [Myxococcales bacterium]|nr:hypothetical protein [Myxococcales bacterium]MCB9705400.1 hypothetical protein [Myxococcales bacterium]